MPNRSEDSCHLMKHIRHFILPLMLVFFISLNVNGKKQPNLVVYMIDDLGWNQISAKQATMGTHTGSFITPNIEKIANYGLSFTPTLNQISPSGPQCSRSVPRTNQ